MSGTQDDINKTSLIIRESFYFLTVLSAVFIAFELIWPNIILAYFNLNYLLMLWFVAGVINLKKIYD